VDSPAGSSVATFNSQESFGNGDRYFVGVKSRYFSIAANDPNFSRRYRLNIRGGSFSLQNSNFF